MTDYDSPWKTTIEFFFEDFLAFFYPQAHVGIDWSKGYEFLDKELEKVVRDAELGRRYVDKLVRVWSQEGEPEFVLIHVEVQGQQDSDFAQRMYVYNYRVFDRYQRKVASFAVLADNNTHWRPSDFCYELWGSRSGLWFPTVKLLDYQRQWEALTTSLNPFATVVMAHLQARRTANDLPGRLSGKVQLIKQLYQKGYQREAILALFHFIDWVIELPEELDQAFWQALTTFEQENKMPYISSVERIGIKKGIEQGIEQGIAQGEAKILLQQLAKRFGPLPAWANEKISQANINQLEHWSLQILDAPSLDAVFTDRNE